MLARIVELSLVQRFLLCALGFALLFGGLYAFHLLDIVAYPDPSPPMVELITQYPGWSAEEIERPNGARIPSKQIATIATQTGAFIIYRENNQRYIPIKFSVRDRDLESTVQEAQQRLATAVQLPARYRMEWAGQYDQLKDEQKRLPKIVPVSLVAILFLLYITFNSLRNAPLVLVAVPFALVGGVLSLVLTGTHFSISAAVGVISTLGVAILGGVLLISRIEDYREAGLPLTEAIRKGADVQCGRSCWQPWRRPSGCCRPRWRPGSDHRLRNRSREWSSSACSRPRCLFYWYSQCCMRLFTGVRSGDAGVLNSERGVSENIIGSSMTEEGTEE